MMTLQLSSEYIYVVLDQTQTFPEISSTCKLFEMYEMLCQGGQAACPFCLTSSISFSDTQFLSHNRMSLHAYTQKYVINNYMSLKYLIKNVLNYFIFFLPILYGFTKIINKLTWKECPPFTVKNMLQFVIIKYKIYEISVQVIVSVLPRLQ